MASPSSKLADSLAALRHLQQQGKVAIRTNDLTRTHLERLVRHGFLRQVLRGWYITSSPDQDAGEATPWYAVYWEFLAAYLTQRFGVQWCVAPEPSLVLHAGNRSVPKQLLVHAARAGNSKLELPHGTSLLELRAALPDPQDVDHLKGLRVYSAPAALVAVTSSFFTHHSVDARTVMQLLTDTPTLVGKLLEGGKSVVAGRLAGAFVAVGRQDVATDIVACLRAVDYNVRPTNPFVDQPECGSTLPAGPPAAARIALLWQHLREQVLAAGVPPSPGVTADPQAYLKAMDEAYTADAYHSLSIEGYQVTPELIQRVQRSDWSPTVTQQDRRDHDAFAARGYFLAHQAVKASVSRVLTGEHPGEVVAGDHAQWYRELFAPSVTAGLLQPADLVGYRRQPVYIRNSMHVPLPADAVPQAMSVLFAQLTHEPDSWVRAVLGHFVFVYIHPYLDGNGRMGRFLANVMLAGGGYPWTIIPVTRRHDYLHALEQASLQQDITAFAHFLAEQVEGHSWSASSLT